MMIKKKVVVDITKKNILNLAKKRLVVPIQGWEYYLGVNKMSARTREKFFKFGFGPRKHWTDRENLVRKNGAWYHKNDLSKPIPSYIFENTLIKNNIARELLFPMKPASEKVDFLYRLQLCAKLIRENMYLRYNMLKAVRRKAKRLFRRKVFPTLSFYKSVNNLFYVLKDKLGNTFHISSVGTFGLKGKKRFERPGMKRVAEDIATRFKMFHMYQIDVMCHAPIRKGIQSILWGFKRAGLQVLRLVDLIKMPHGNVRLPARRRMKRRKR